MIFPNVLLDLLEVVKRWMALPTFMVEDEGEGPDILLSSVIVDHCNVDSSSTVGVVIFVGREERVASVVGIQELDFLLTQSEQ